MKRTPFRFLAVTLAIGGAAACASTAPVGVTTSESLVTGCEKVGDVTVSSEVAPGEVHGALSDAAREKGANYVLVLSDDARTGAAYRCAMPGVASR